MSEAEKFLDTEIQKPYLSGLQNNYTTELDKDQLLNLLNNHLKTLANDDNTSHDQALNIDSVVNCANPFHNMAVEHDGICHMCDGSKLI